MAFDILLRVERGQSHSDDLLRGEAASALAVPDRNLATALVLGVLRWQLRLDQVIRAELSRPSAKLDTEVLIALRMGAFQLLHFDRIPPRAAIDESVELTKQAGHRFASGMVNAVLRKLAARREKEPDSESSPAIELAAYPQWMRDRWTKFFGDEKALAICRYGLEQPALAIRVLDPESEAELAREGVQVESGELITSARIVLSGDVTKTAAFREGRVRIQDEGSQLVAEIAGQGRSILDCCAAPGGKTLILAERNPSARVVALEASPQRLAALGNRVAHFGDRVECRLADATLITDDPTYDLVLADVPCGGTGTLGRNPEIRHRLRPEDLPRQAERQRAILASALRAARPGGRVVYSTCSLEPEENELVVEAVMQQSSNVTVLPMQLRIEEMRAERILTPAAGEKLLHSITQEGYLRLIPGACGTDGFFVAVLKSSA